MWNDVVDLREFYDSALGQVARRMIRRRIRLIWPDLHGLRLLGLGYATPYLRPFKEEAERTLAAMPAAQGVVPWPPEGPGLVTLAEETDLPFPDRSMDRVLVIHCLESTEHQRGMMREIWRVLADGGRVLMLAANRRSLWARLERTPFGQGRPYTPAQLHRLLRDTMFMPLQSQAALFVPPLRSRVMLRSAPAWEKLGENWFPRFAGVVLVEATKQLYAGTAVRERAEAHRAYVPLPQGLRRAGELDLRAVDEPFTSSASTRFPGPPGFEPEAPFFWTGLTT
jgi:SAM-dependent methyltransferase